MSLLMEALKKAEEAKRQLGEGPAADLTLAPLAPAAASSAATGGPSGQGSRLPDLSLHTDSLDADLVAMSTAGPAVAAATSRPGATPRSPDDVVERAAARNVFSAKQPAPRPRSSLPLIFAVGGLAMVVLGAYFWWQLQSLSTGTLAPLAPLATSTAPPRTLPRPPGVAANEVVIAEQPTAPKAVAVAESARASIAPPAVAKAQTTPVVRAASTPVPGTPRASKPSRSVQPAAPAVPGEARPLRISRSQPKPNRSIEDAYDALLAGQFDRAQRDYELVLRRDPKNTDALLGLATIAAHQQQNEQAHQYYLAALESDPTDATAQAGLVSTGGQSDLGLAESRLKTALASQPESSALYFALGNVYARQARWSEAQQAYFRAYSIEPDNADLIFNQAVSLDHLHKNRLAAQYYRMALTAADRDGVARPVAFDRQQTRNRLQELQSQ